MHTSYQHISTLSLLTSGDSSPNPSRVELSQLQHRSGPHCISRVL
jgi:hypothetical protein